MSLAGLVRMWVGVLTVTSALSAQDVPRVLAEQVTCPQCDITAFSVARIGEEDGAGALVAIPHSIVRTRDGYVVLHGREVSLFGVNGAWIRNIGAAGAGPGEFRQASKALRIAADSILIIDPANGRANVFAPRPMFARSFLLAGSISDAVLLHDASIVVTAAFHDPDRIGLPLHVFTLGGEYLRSFGNERPEIRPDQPNRLRRELAPSPSTGHVWSARQNEYRVELWDPNGRLVRTIRRQPSWFPIVDEPYYFTTARPPQPLLKAVSEDSAGRLWVAAWIAGRDWRRALRGAQGEGGLTVHEVTDWTRLYDTVIDVIDLRSGRLIKSARYERLIMGFLGGGVAWTMAQSSSGAPLAEVWQLSINDPTVR